MTRGLPLSEVWRDQAGWTAARVRGVWPPDVGGGRHDLPGHADAAADLVSGHVVGRQPEDRRERHRLAAGAGPWELRDGVDVAAYVAAGDGDGGPERA